MKEKLLSIIIPVYNAEKYVDKLLQVFLKQDLEKVEIILIDDGSKDNSLNICNKYAKTNESFVVYHQKNGGASVARNKGIEIAKGKYIVFVDSDDSISERYVESICNVCETYQADLVQFDAYIKKSEEISKREFKLNEGYTELDEYYNHVLNQEVNEPWDKVYKADIIHDNGIFFDTNMTVGEDVSLTIAFLRYAKKVYIHHDAYYFYERNDAGICANAKLKHLDDLEILYKSMKDFERYMKLSEGDMYISNDAMLKGVFRTVGLVKRAGETNANIVEKMSALENINELLHLKYTEKSIEIRKQLLCKRLFSIVSWIVALKN